MSISLDDTDRRLLEILQRAFPLTPRPFDEIAAQLGLSPEDVLGRVQRLKSRSVIRQISAIFDSAALGYSGSLVAFKVAPRDLDEVAAVVTAHQGVSHCYSRAAEYNLWFTITVGPGSDLRREVDALAATPGVMSCLFLPAIKVFKIGVFLKMTEEPTKSVPSAGRARSSAVLSADDWRAVRALQRDLPLVPEPFAALAADAGRPVSELLERAVSLLETGVMRRFAAVLRHQHAGYRHNAMVCWRVEQDRIDEVGRLLASDPAVSHCYERPADPEWPYPLYTMLHARSQSELDLAALRLSRLVGTSDYLALPTLKEYKKTRVTYQ